MLSLTMMVPKIFRRRRSVYEEDIAKGLNSANFNLKDNIKNNDDERGLDSELVEDIMEEDACDFDEARLLLFYKKCCENNIDPISGLPLDPKAGFFPKKSEIASN
ncbi:hypothetical protein K502DRAFT_323273 [Neoconidiobolus thromboides FSU 785]|nr:hypothetical protein K502DRAFT_323273 [Neoconidiobolus thromboides FSU 785]